MVKNDAGKMIRDARKAKGITQKELAQLLDCSHTTISKYEQGEIENMPRQKMKQLSEILGVPPVKLFGLEKNPITNKDSGMSEVKAKLIDKVMNMSDDELEKLDLLLRIVEAKS